MVVEDVIPKGLYCYSYDENGNFHVCPYWNYVDREIAYCAFLNSSDADGLGLGLLWDQVKECGVNEPD